MGALFTVAATIIFAISLRKYRKDNVSKYHNDDQGLNVLRGFNPYRDHFQDGGRRHDGITSLSSPRIHQTSLEQSTRSLDPNDIELLQFYRRKGSRDNSLPVQENVVECNFDKELLNSYRRREQMKQYNDDASDISTSQTDTLEKRYSEEHTNSLWDEYPRRGECI